MQALDLLAFYFGCGLVCGFAFVLFGVERALGHSVTVSAGARLVLLPGSIILWPIVLYRWTNGGSRI
jgi:hypothetical protein